MIQGGLSEILVNVERQFSLNFFLRWWICIGKEICYNKYTIKLFKYAKNEPGILTPGDKEV